MGAIEPDLVVSLHACDTATDYALAYGIRNKARGIIAVPCCHSELLSQYRYDPFKEILKQGVLKARMADILTWSQVHDPGGLWVQGFGCGICISPGYPQEPVNTGYPVFRLQPRKISGVSGTGERASR